jgi:type II secretory pathway pseudopilin PulG
LCFGKKTAVLIIGILAAIAIPNYIGQQKEAKDSAAMAQLRTAATSQDLYHAKQDAFANTATRSKLTVSGKEGNGLRW